MTIIAVGITQHGELYVRYNDKVGRFVQHDICSLPQNVQDAFRQLHERVITDVETECQDGYDLFDAAIIAIQHQPEVTVHNWLICS